MNKRTCVFVLIFALITSLGGCATSVSPKSAINEELRAQIEEFRAAVQNRNTDKLYSMMALNITSQLDKDQFTAYFNDNYEIFVEYAEALYDDSESFSIRAQIDDDPCGSLSLALDKNGQWKVDRNDFSSNDNFAHKRHLISLIQSYQFTLALQQYAKKTPELSSQKQRAILRTIAASDIQPENVTFSGNQAAIIIPDKVRIMMTCMGNAWRLDQCSSLR